LVATFSLSLLIEHHIIAEAKWRSEQQEEEANSNIHLLPFQK